MIQPAAIYVYYDEYDHPTRITFADDEGFERDLPHVVGFSEKYDAADGRRPYVTVSFRIPLRKIYPA